MIYGGVALIVLGIVFIIENSESFPFAIFLFVIGGVLILAGYKQNKPSNKSTLTDRMISRYHLPNSEAIKMLCLLIENNTNEFNSQNSSNVLVDNVADLIFRRFIDNMQTLSTEDINNKLFGFMGYVFVCCILLTDAQYKELKNEVSKDFELPIEGFSQEEAKRELLNIMDDCYIDYQIQQLEEPTKLLNGEELMRQAISKLLDKYNIKDEAI